MKTTSINFNGLELISDDFAFGINGLFDFDKDTILNDVFSDGQSFNRSKVKSKTLTIQGFIKNWNFPNIIALNAALSGNGLKPLIVNVLELNTPVTLMVEVTSRAATVNNSRKISISVIAPDPFMYASNVVTVTLGSTSSNSLTFPLLFPLNFGAFSGGEGIITNVGNTIGYPILMVVGQCSNIVITNETTGEVMILNITLGASDTLIIDNTPANRGIYLNGVANMGLKSGSWLSCLIGDNSFSFSTNTLQSVQDCNCVVSFNPRWC